MGTSPAHKASAVGATAGTAGGDEDKARPSSCPDERQINQAVAAIKDDKVKLSTGVCGCQISAKGQSSSNHVLPQDGVNHEVDSGHKDFVQDGKKPPASIKHSSIQTDEFLVFPYEHLFPSVMPQWFMVR